MRRPWGCQHTCPPVNKNSQQLILCHPHPYAHAQTLRSTHSHAPRVPNQARRSSKACSLKFKVLLLWYIHTECRHCYGNGQGQGSLWQRVRSDSRHSIKIQLQ